MIDVNDGSALRVHDVPHISRSRRSDSVVPQNSMRQSITVRSVAGQHSRIRARVHMRSDNEMSVGLHWLVLPY
jgi:hypothetical protein